MQLKHFFLQSDNSYQSKRLGYGALLLSVFWLTIAVSYILNIEKNNIFKQPYWIVALIGAVVTFRIFAQQVNIDKQRNIISKSYFGMFRREYPISDINGFNSLKHIALIFHNGTDIIIEFKNRKPVKILDRIGRTKTVQSMISEIDHIISSG